MPCLLLAQDPFKGLHVVRASGEATVSAKPDRAQVSVGVITEANTAEKASQQNASQTSDVLKMLKDLVGSAGEIKTTGYSIGPEYQFSSGNPPKISGYHANNTVLVTVSDLSFVGKIIDAAVKSGANDLTISFLLKSDDTIRAEALREAAKKARANAEAIAYGLDLHVVRVLQAETTNVTPIRPIMLQAGAMAKAATPTPIEAGTLDVHASVTVTVEVQ